MPPPATTIRLLELGPLLARYVDVVYEAKGEPAPDQSTLIRHFAIAGLKAAAEKLPKAQRDQILGGAAGKK